MNFRVLVMDSVSVCQVCLDYAATPVLLSIIGILPARAVCNVSVILLGLLERIVMILDNVHARQTLKDGSVTDALMVTMGLKSK